MADTFEPIKIDINVEGATDAVNNLDLVISRLEKLKEVSKSVSNVMKTKFDLSTKNYIRNTQKNSFMNVDTINNIDNSMKDYSKTIVKTSDTIKKSANNTASMSRSALKLGITLISTRKIINYLSDAMEESASWVENLNVMEVAFGNMSDSAYQFVKTLSGFYGLDANQILRYVSLFQQMADAMGQTEDNAYKMSTALTSIGVDTASLYNTDIGVTMEALRSAIAGQVKPVRQFGFDITSYSIDSLLEQIEGMGNVTSRSLSQAQKQLARTILLIQQSKNVWGDLAKTLNTYSNQQKILSAQFTNLKRALGDLFVGTEERVGIATKSLYYINGVIMSIVETIRYFIPEASSSGFNKVEEDVNDITDAVEELDETINGSLLSFDKFNTLSKGTSEDSSITDLLSKTLAEKYDAYLDEWNKKMEALNSKAHEIRNSIMQWLGFSKDTNNEWQLMGGSRIDEIRASIVQITDFIKEVTPYIFSIAKDILPTILKAIEKILPVISKLIFYVSDFVSALSDANAPTQVFFITLGALVLAVTSKFAVLKLTVLGLLAIFSNWSNMSGWAKIVSIAGVLTTAIFGLAIATGTLQSTLSWGIAAAGIIAGITAIVASVKSASNIKAYAKGGIPDEGQLFIANEAGAELVGNIGGQTAVANNDMIVQAIEQASFRGISRAMSSSGSSNTINFSFNGVNSNELARAIAQPMASELKRQGYRISKI